MKKTNDPWRAYRDRRGNVDFDAMPEEVKLAFIRESECAAEEELTPAEWRRFEKWRKRAVGRPRVGEGFQRWNISLEKAFARRVATYARTHGMTRSRVLAEGAKLLLSHAA